MFGMYGLESYCEIVVLVDVFDDLCVEVFDVYWVEFVDVVWVECIEFCVEWML